jgi:hypothetical protein
MSLLTAGNALGSDVTQMLESLIAATTKGSPDAEITFNDDEDVFKRPPVLDSNPALRTMIFAEDVSLGSFISCAIVLRYNLHD